MTMLGATLSHPVMSAAPHTRTSHSIPAFAPLVSNAFDDLVDLPAKVDIPKGTLLVSQGTTGDTVSLLQNGVVKLFSTSKDGRHATIGLRSSGWYAGGAAAFLDTANTYSVVALTHCSIIRSPARMFAQSLAQNIPLAMHFLSTMANETIGMSQLRLELIAHSAEERLSVFIEERSRSDSEGEIMDPLPHLKQVDLAHLLSLTPEHLNRLLRKMKQPQEQVET